MAVLQDQPVHFEHDHAAKLVRMANQIGAFFESQREDIRIPGIAEHIGQFWDKKMRRDIYAYLDQGAEGLAPVVVAALQQLRSTEKTKNV
jgi:formate dehydrogenase subunit delta